MRPRIEVKEVAAGTPEALWRERILQWAENGLAQVEFCREHGLSLDEFRRYRTRLSRPAKTAPKADAHEMPAGEAGIRRGNGECSSRARRADAGCAARQRPFDYRAPGF